MNAQFAALREDMAGRFDAVHRVRISLQSQITGMQSPMNGMHRQMLVLHEDLIDRIKRIGEKN